MAMHPEMTAETACLKADANNGENQKGCTQKDQTDEDHLAPSIPYKTIDADGIAARIEDLKQQRQAASVRAGQLQEEFNKTVVQVHQLDGAIAALEQLVAKHE